MSMSATMTTALPGASGLLRRGENGLRQAVETILATFLPQTRTRRTQYQREPRYPFPFLLQLTPVQDETTTSQGTPICVVGKNLSSRGIGFYHQQPIPFRKAIVTIEDGSGRQTSFLVELSWCRFTRQGWYDSGGRFLSVISPPSESPSDLLDA